MIHITFIQTPIGKIGLSAENGALVRVFFDASGLPEQWIRDDRDPALVEAGRQLTAYFAGGLRDFDLPLVPAVSDFAASVLRETARIPYGETVSYGEIAARIAARRGLAHMSAQAVGGAVGRNPISLIIPCHRVVGADGSLTGYAGGLERKERLLALEGRIPLRGAGR